MVVGAATGRSSRSVPVQWYFAGTSLLGLGAILEHHEHFDGTDYPHDFSGGDISMAARSFPWP